MDVAAFLHSYLRDWKIAGHDRLSFSSASFTNNGKVVVVLLPSTISSRCDLKKDVEEKERSGKPTFYIEKKKKRKTKKDTQKKNVKFLRLRALNLSLLRRE